MRWLDRRAFLAAAGAVLAAQSSASQKKVEPAVVAPLPPARRRIKKALKYGMIEGDLSVRAKFELAKRCGFDGVEMDSPSELSIEEILAAKQATGLVIPGVVDSVHWKAPLSAADPETRAQGRAALEQAIRDCHALDGTSVLLVPAVVNASTSYKDAWERSRPEIHAVLPLAKELGVQIAFENVWNHFLLSPLEAARYVDEFDSQWIGWHFDVGNVVNYGWPEQWIQVLGKRILKLDVKEYSRKKRDELGLWKGFDVEIGDGDCGWPAVMAALDAFAYEGWATAEVGGGGEERLRDVAQRMTRVLAL